MHLGRDPGTDQLFKWDAAEAKWSCAADESFVYDGQDFALSGQTCAVGTAMAGVGPDGTPVCVPDRDTTYDGRTFALSGKACEPGKAMVGVDATGEPVCAPDRDTTYGPGAGMTLNAGGEFAADPDWMAARAKEACYDTAAELAAALEGRCVPATAFPLVGDVSGVPGATEVTALRGRPISADVPLDGQILVYRAAQSAWVPQTIPVPKPATYRYAVFWYL